MSDDLNALLQDLYPDDDSKRDLNEASQNLVNFFEILLEIDQEQKRKQDD